MTDVHRVVVLALDRIIPLDLAIPVQVFSGSADLPYRVQVCAPGPRVRSTTGFDLLPDGGLGLLARADTIVVPGYRPHARRPPAVVLDGLRRAHDRGTRLVSICVGAFALAHAGLLDGRPATTHWQNTAELAACFPTTDVRADVLYVDDADVLTSAGVSSGMDLCLHIVRRDHGVDVAQRVARALVAAPHRDGNQAQFTDRPIDHGAHAFADICDYISHNLQDDLGLAALAARCHMSTRTLSRRFRDATGTTPVQWVQSVRSAEARRLLETTDLGVDEVAERSGFGTALALRTHFRRRLSTSPTAYRRTFHTSF